MKNSFYNRKNLLGKNEIHGFWRDFKLKHPEYKDISRSELTKIVHGFFSHVSETLITEEHGVILNGIGYFANTVFNTKKVLLYGDNKMVFNFNNDNIYITYFFPRVFKTNPLNSWSFKLYRPFKDRMKDLINSGIKYICHYDILKTNAQGSKYYNKDK